MELNGPSGKNPGTSFTSVIDNDWAAERAIWVTDPLAFWAAWYWPAKKEKKQYLKLLEMIGEEPYFEEDDLI